MWRRSRSTPHVYYGHRANSFRVTDEHVLTEIRARQRTFDGATYRTAIGNLSYAIVVLKLFDQRFYRSAYISLNNLFQLFLSLLLVGLLYIILSILLFIIGYIRSISSRHDFADEHRPADSTSGERVFGRPFVTAGWNVVAISLLVAVVEMVLLAFVLTV